MVNDNEQYDCIVKDGVVIDMTNNKGWICPRCGQVVSPKLMTCPYCNAARTDEGIADNEQFICG